MFCIKCGNEMTADAAFCPKCGNPTGNTPVPVASTTATVSEDYIVIKEFEDAVRSMYTVSIFSLVLCFGIGLIFSFIVWAKAKNLEIPFVTTKIPTELAMLNSAKRKLKTALNFASIANAAPLILVIALLLTGQIVAAVATMAVLLLIMFLVGIPCTKHLTDLLY